MKKIKKILVGTHNDGKFKELSYLLSKKIIKLSPKKLKIKSPRETGKTFLSNSKLKANYFYKHSNVPSISDDSGLTIKCLSGKPGIYSARWAKKYGSFNIAMKKILKLVALKNKKIDNSEAKFVCSLTIKMSNKKSISVIGRIDGYISKKILGKNGFGYDSIFIPKGQKLTFGQMSKKKKLLMDHRFIAFTKLKKKSTVL